MKNILVTGCNGQLGSELRELTQQDNGGMTFFFTDIEQLDITDKEAVNRYVNEHEIDCIVNCAAFTAVDLAESKADFCRVLNEEAPAILARAVAGRGGSMIQISTDYVFDGTAHIPYREEDAVCPVSVYGKTKLGGERAGIGDYPHRVAVFFLRQELCEDHAAPGTGETRTGSGGRSGGYADLCTRSGPHHTGDSVQGTGAGSIPLQQRGSRLLV